MSVKTKICGLRTREAVAEALVGGADYLGFVFYPPSPRALSPAAAASLAAEIPPGPVRVGLFVDADDRAIAEVLGEVPLDLLQFHGSEPAERVAEARARFARPVMKAIPIAGAEDLVAAERYQGVADLLLFDAKPPRRADALPGGNGLAFDWRLLAGCSWRCPWMLSGGLTAECLAEAVALSGAAIVDVSTGVESSPGQKDLGKIKAFLAAAHAL